MRRSVLNLVSKQIRNIAAKAKPEPNSETVRTVATVTAVPSENTGSISQENVQHRIILPRDKKASEKQEPFDVVKHLPTAVVKNNSVNIHRGLGSWVWDQSGEKYLDMTSGIGVLGTGHCHPKVISAIKDQLTDIMHAQQSMFLSHSMQDEFVEKFLRYTPGGGTHMDICPESNVPKHDTFLFCCSGSEATENAVKVAKMHTQRPNIIAMQKGFHGRTFGAMAWSSSKTSYKSGFLNNMGGTTFLTDLTPQGFDNLLAHQTRPDETAAVILEPIQGEGGVNQLSKELMQHIRKRCDEHGIVLIFDEVQSGSGRCTDGTTFWAHQLVGVEPDLLAFAKAIGSGMPLGGICGPKKFFDGLSNNALGGTYGGNPVCLAAASATLDVIENENLLVNAHEMGKLIAKNLSTFPYIESIRQHGCLIAVDLDPVVTPVGRVLRKAVTEENLILHSCGSNALRIIPAYNINEEEVEIFTEKLYAVLKGIEKKEKGGGLFAEKDRTVSEMPDVDVM